MGSSFSSTSQPLSDSSQLPSLPQLLEPSHLLSKRPLGKGLSGIIYETTVCSGSQPELKYARKDFPLGSVERSLIFEKEVQLLFDLDHPNIVKCFSYTKGRSICSLLQEYMDDDLHSTIQRRIAMQRKLNSTSKLRSRVLDVDEIEQLFLCGVEGVKATTSFQGDDSETPQGTIIPFKVPEVVSIISQIASGMKFLHDQKVVHGDLKPKNVLVCSNMDRMTVKVADFGLVETKKRIKLVSKHSRHFKILTWRAPELFSDLLGPQSEYSDSSFTDSDTDDEEAEDSSKGVDDFLRSKLVMADVYSFGLICLHIIGGKVVYPDLPLTQLRRHKLYDPKPQVPDVYSKQLRALIYECLERDPSRRPSFSHICDLIEHLPERLKWVERGYVHFINNSAAFDFKLEEAKLADKTVVVYFTATWCRPSHEIAPFFAELSMMYENLIFFKVDVNDVEDVTIAWEVTAVPTFVFIKNKVHLDRIQGTDLSELQEMCNHYANTS